MSFILEDARGQTLCVNAWNWGTLHHAVACATPPIFDDEDLLDLLRYGGAVLSQSQIDALYRYLNEEILPQLSVGQRMLADLSISVEADDGAFHRDDLTKNYSLQHEVLLAVVQFLQHAQVPLEVW